MKQKEKKIQEKNNSKNNANKYFFSLQKKGCQKKEKKRLNLYILSF